MRIPIVQSWTRTFPVFWPGDCIAPCSVWVSTFVPHHVPQAGGEVGFTCSPWAPHTQHCFHTAGGAGQQCVEGDDDKVGEYGRRQQGHRMQGPGRRQQNSQVSIR